MHIVYDGHIIMHYPTNHYVFNMKKKLEWYTKRVPWLYVDVYIKNYTLPFAAGSPQ